MLVQSSADVNYQLHLVVEGLGYKDTSLPYFITTPLVLALARQNYTITSLLLDNNINLDARSDYEPKDILDLYSIRALLNFLPRRENVVRLTAKLSGYDRLMTMLEEWKLSQDQDRLIT